MNQFQLRKYTTNSERVKLGHVRCKQSMIESEPYEKEEFLDIIKNIDLLSYSGKGGNRTLLREDKRLFKSIIVYTDFFKDKSSKLRWVERLLICNNNFIIEKSMLCKCGSKSSFDTKTQKFTKMFCRKCFVSSCSKEWFKIKYNDDWLNEYNLFYSDEDRVKGRREIGRKSWFIRKGRAFNGCLCKGKNETKILDFLQTKYNVTIRRGVEICGYYVDGYSEENNTVYEVYEKYHMSQISYDERRRHEIMDYKKCNFIIVFDKEENLLEELTFKKYVQA
jgi:hypothetical protein